MKQNDAIDIYQHYFDDVVPDRSQDISQPRCLLTLKSEFKMPAFFCYTLPGRRVTQGPQQGQAFRQHDLVAPRRTRQDRRRLLGQPIPATASGHVTVLVHLGLGGLRRSSRISRRRSHS